LDWFKANENQEPDYLVHIRPTTPLRESRLIDMAVQMLIENQEATALRSVHEIPESPYKMFGIKNGLLEGLYPEDPRPEYYNLPRQNFPPVYKPNGYVDIIKRKTVRETESLHGLKMIAFVTPASVEVDSQEEFDFLEYAIRKKQHQIFDYLKDHYQPV
jgi:CMP-N,N'-diacetyllegionaminic acid synthase